MSSESLPERIPIFPLPNVVLFPQVFLPLHIFEPRYREMVADAIDGDRLIGMALLREGWQRHAGPNPPIFPIGCAGRITHVASLPDGRYNIVLRGVDRFRVRDEDQSRAYRIGVIELLADGSTAGRQEHLQAGRQRIENLLDRQATVGAAARIPPGMADA
ncbi:MAG: ATP-dependent protease, partial [Acidobacteria bacterium]|nr:ATP-dependent protease [Acidobacteriota bacterium]